MALFYLLISALPFTEHPLFSHFVGDLTITKYLGAVCLGVALVRVMSNGRVPDLLSTTQAKLFLLFIALVMISYVVLGGERPIEISPFALYFSLLLQFLITPVFVDSTARLRGVLLAEIGSIAFASLYVIREWQVYHNVYSNFRPGAVVGDSNYFGVSVVACLPLNYFLILLPLRLWQRVFAAVCLVLTLTAFMLGASRGGLLGLMAASLFIVLHSKQRVRNLIVIFAIIVPLSLAVPTSPLRRLTDPSYSDRAAVRARTIAWNAGVGMIQAHPLLGVGLGNFKSMSLYYEDPNEVYVSVAHNTYIEFAAEVGIPGLLLFLAIQVSSFLSTEKIRRACARSGRPFMEHIAIGFQAGMIGSFVALIFVSGQVQKLFWLQIFLTMCLPAILKGVRHKGVARPLPSPASLEVPVVG